MASEHLPDVRIKKSAVRALQTDMESMIVDMFSDANQVAIKAGERRYKWKILDFLKILKIQLLIVLL